tara:strand:+ start:692 stop:1438 length:747 start_codon:yes stop_codon:yes gene_type:complete
MKRLTYIIFALSLVLPLGVQAQQVNASSSEDVALLFYKTGSAIPNFTSWIEETPEYHHTPWAKREKKMRAEKNKLALRYQNTSPENDLIKIKVPVELSLQIIEENTEKPIHVLSLKFVGANNIDYFPYKFMEQNIAVIPTNLKLFKNNKISKKKFIAIKPLAEKARNNIFSAIIELQAQNVDITQPYNLDGIDQWIFRTRIAIFSVFDSKNNVIWERMEPWYTSPITENLNNLYDGQYKEEPEYISSQ